MSEARELLDEGLRLEKAGSLDRALELYTAALDSAPDAATESEAWRRQSHTLRVRCDWDAAVEAARRSAEIASAADLGDHVAEALNAEAAVYQTRGDFEPARALYERILEQTDDDRIRGVALQNRASLAGMQDDFAAAERDFREAHACFERAEYAWGRAHVLNNLGRVAFEQGKIEEAEQSLLDAIHETKLLGDLDLLALARLNYAEVLLERSNHEEAESVVSASLGHFTTAGNQWRRIDCLRVLGDLYARRDVLDVANRFYDAALQVAEEIGAKAEHRRIEERIRNGGGRAGSH